MAEDRESRYLFSEDILVKLRQEVEASEDLDFVDDSNQDETIDALNLIKGGYIDSNIFNTGGWLKECEARLRSPKTTPTIVSDLLDQVIAEGYEIPNAPRFVDSNSFKGGASGEAISLLDFQWKYYLETGIGGEKYKKFQNSIPNSLHGSPVESFIDTVYGGLYPTPELIVSIAKCFSLYFDAEGELSLEDVFFGKPVKGAGSFSRRAYKHRLHAFFNETIEREKAFRDASGNPESIDLSDFTEDFLSYHVDYVNEDDGASSHSLEVIEDRVESFLRAHRRWKSANPEMVGKLIVNSKKEEGDTP